MTEPLSDKELSEIECLWALATASLRLAPAHEPQLDAQAAALSQAPRHIKALLDEARRARAAEQRLGARVIELEDELERRRELVPLVRAPFSSPCSMEELVMQEVPSAADERPVAEVTGAGSSERGRADVPANEREDAKTRR